MSTRARGQPRRHTHLDQTRSNGPSMKTSGEAASKWRLHSRTTSHDVSRSLFVEPSTSGSVGCVRKSISPLSDMCGGGPIHRTSTSRFVCCPRISIERCTRCYILKLRWLENVSNRFLIHHHFCWHELNVFEPLFCQWLKKKKKAWTRWACN